MNMVVKGHLCGTCPSCEGEVRYLGRNEDGGDEAACHGCGEVYEVTFDDEEEEQPQAPAPAPPPPPKPAPPPPRPPAPKPAPATLPRGPVPPAPPAVAQAAEPALKPVVVGNQKPQPSLDAGQVANFGETNMVSDYLKKSRPWRWAQKLGETGNPYRPSTRNHAIYDIYANGPCRIEDCVVQAAGLSDKISFVLAVYEVTYHCLVAGLLVMDQDTRIISPCQGKPVPFTQPI